MATEASIPLTSWRLVRRYVFPLVDCLRKLAKCGRHGVTLPVIMERRAISGERLRCIALVVAVADILGPSGNLNCKQEAGHHGMPDAGVSRA
jgi:hypothetical protein